MLIRCLRLEISFEWLVGITGIACIISSSKWRFLVLLKWSALDKCRYFQLLKHLPSYYTTLFGATLCAIFFHLSLKIVKFSERFNSSTKWEGHCWLVIYLVMQCFKPKHILWFFFSILSRSHSSINASKAYINLRVILDSRTQMD